ncbi:metal-dependent hydrolase family protein [Bosea sp. (in: a-proteobacteria)]|uniref:metal-dependent hydrolase family protein n=1 Tax=Bosea sp. (in: a-proteobacteria) TaxID=1871050 RepID=UPI002B4A5AFC|nr:amidohydrolase family protein [Bosea sp. (in: a-proteobacteria)]WRH60268.1 MAG: amidohydrolase family protein [Bosea sp. (in: a-proteobacteria)]
MNLTLFTGGRFLDPEKDRLLEGIEVLVEGDRIREVSDRPITAANATRIDLRGRTLMPGLIDMHVHVVSAVVNGVANAMTPSSLVALRAGRVMNAMLMRGFTTVRDLGGADLGLVLAVEEGLISGPRLIICGKALSQTGGHSDPRDRSETRPLYTGRLGQIGQLCDGVDAVRLAAREQLRAGATFVKIMANGGVASPNDPIHALGFSKDEIRAAVEEAENAGTYVAAHLYTDKAIARAVECGVQSLEHCNLIQAETAKKAAAAGAFAVPTLAAYEGLALEGSNFGLRPESAAKIETVRKGGMESLSIMREAGLPMGYGSDLLGQLQKYQTMEFELRSRVLPMQEVLQSATTTAAKLCRMEGEIGALVPGAHADLLVVDGDPLSDPQLFQNDGRALRAIMRGGQFFKNELH